MTHNKKISNSEDVIDSRDVIARIEELEEEKSEFILNESNIDEEKSPSWEDVADANAEAESKWDETDEGQELKTLLAFAEQVENYSSDWKYGAILIRDSYFDADWAENEMVECGYLNNDLPYILRSNINFEGIKDDLQMDYTSVEFDGVTYWIR